MAARRSASRSSRPGKGSARAPAPAAAAVAAPPARLALLWRSFSAAGLILGTLFFAASLTPSLIPRTFVLQGALAGVSFAAGYAIGVALDGLWRFMQLPVPGERIGRPVTWIAMALSLVVVLAFLWRAAFWQNSIRLRMDMPPVEGAQPLAVAAIALAVFAVIILIARLFQAVYRRSRGRVGRYVPERVSLVIGIAAAVLLFVLIVNGVLMRVFLNGADRSAAAFDALIEPQFPAPADPMATGSAQSLVSWEDLGRAGREFVASGPTQDEIASFLGREAKRPIRVYAGLNSAPDADARAALALKELQRQGAFDRSVLIVATPTGTGWMDPAATAPIEYLHAGDTAIVAVQYSYLSSPLSLLVEPDFSLQSGRAIFRAVYGYWTTLPKDHRPKLYLFGLSLGAYGSDQAFGLHEVLADPFNGALWVGPPFATPGWRRVTDERNPGSPEWLPTFGDGSVVRFTNQENHLDIPGAHWGPLRIVYLQYASDPVTFFSTSALWRKPDWMNAPVGPDVSPELRWYPVVTSLQLMLDNAIGLMVPIGHGHYYAPQHYIDAWAGLTDPPGWTPEAIDRLKQHFAG